MGRDSIRPCKWLTSCKRLLSAYLSSCHLAGHDGHPATCELPSQIHRRDRQVKAATGNGWFDSIHLHLVVRSMSSFVLFFFNRVATSVDPRFLVLHATLPIVRLVAFRRFRRPIDGRLPPSPPRCSFTPKTRHFCAQGTSFPGR